MTLALVRLIHHFMPVATELRLQIDPRHIARLRNHPRLKRAAGRAARKLHIVYYDTDDLDLWRAGITLRLRRAGNRWTQTVWKMRPLAPDRKNATIKNDRRMTFPQRQCCTMIVQLSREATSGRLASVC